MTPTIKNLISASVTLLVPFLSACNTELNIEFEEKATFEEALGIWERRGYGDIYHLTSVNTKVYQYTRKGCLLGDQFTVEETKEQVTKDFVISKDGRSARLKVSEAGAFPVHFHQRDALPDMCKPDQLINISTPEVVFEHLWHTFNDYYAFFEKRGVDWKAQYRTYHPLISNEMTDEQLFTLIAAMLSPLNDGHVMLAAGDKRFTAEEDSQLEKDLYDAFTAQSEFANFGVFANEKLTQINSITLSNVADIHKAGGEDEDALLWGMLPDNLGYLNISRMAALLKDGDFENSTKEADASGKIMDQVLNGLKDTDGLIIDLRKNPGGHDTVSLEIASRFFKDDLNVLSKFAKNNWGTSQTVNAYFTPKKPYYSKPVAILTSDITASAAEVFLMTMRARPNKTLIVGNRSAGELSDILQKALPNDWNFSLSNEMYQDFRGVHYETTGIPTDIEVAAFSLAHFNNGSDEALDTAIEAIRQ